MMMMMIVFNKQYHISTVSRQAIATVKSQAELNNHLLAWMVPTAV